MEIKVTIDEGIRLDKYLMSSLDVSRSKAQKLIDGNNVLVNGNGYLCDPNSIESIKEALVSIINTSIETPFEISDNTNWNKRYRENMVRIKSGDLLEVAAVIKSLIYRDNERGLSTGERKMLHSAKQIFISELVIAMGIAYEEAENLLFSAIG